MHKDSEYKIWAFLLTCSLLAGLLLVLQETPLHTANPSSISLRLENLIEEPPQEDARSLASNNTEKNNQDQQNRQMRQLQKEISAQLQRMQNLQEKTNPEAQENKPQDEEDENNSADFFEKNPPTEQPKWTAQEQAPSQYKGHSSFIYILRNRKIVQEFAPIYTCPKGGQVSINIEVDRMGNILRAQISHAVDPDKACLAEQSMKNIYKNKFNKDLTAEKVQKGKIIFNFAGQRS